MLKKIISITGKPGLFRLLTQGKQTLIVEELGTGRRFPATARDKVVSLGDIAMYTESGDTPLGEILDKVFAVYQGKPIDVKALASKSGALKEEFAKIVEDFDRMRVHDGDVKKLFNWYNLLIASGFDKFAEEKEGEEDQSKLEDSKSTTEEGEEKAEPKKEVKEKKEKPVKKTTASKKKDPKLVKDK